MLYLKLHVVLLVGLKLESVWVVYVSVVLLGLFLGVSLVALFELMIEVTYPLHFADVFVATVIGVGFMYIASAVVERALLDSFGAEAALAFPFTLLLISIVLLMIQKMPFHRQGAEESARQPLLQEEKK